jgi:hypothetical protein
VIASQNSQKSQTALIGFFKVTLRNPVQRGHRFQRKADSIPVIADSK